MEYKHSRNQVYLINYHLIWCPKRRKSVLVGKVKKRLEQIIKEVAKEKGVEILKLSIQPNHVHNFISAYPTVAVHKLVKAFKGRSSHLPYGLTRILSLLPVMSAVKLYKNILKHRANHDN